MSTTYSLPPVLFTRGFVTRRLLVTHFHLGGACAVSRSRIKMASASALPNLYQGVEKGSFGYKMLANMGWKEGQGLVRALFLPACFLCTECCHGQFRQGSSLIAGSLGCTLQGANKQGIKEHVKVKKKQDALGVGAVSCIAVCSVTAYQVAHVRHSNCRYTQLRAVTGIPVIIAG